MTNHELITKLNSLKNIEPDQNWLKSNRELLLSQVSNSSATTLSVWKIFIINLQSVAKTVSKPAYALGAFVLVLISASLSSQQLFARTKPNDSLYIARIISEKLKLNTTFNSQERDKLAVQYATEHAQDITAVLSDPNFNTEANKEQVAKLQENFSQEVANVKTTISRLPAAVKSVPTSEISVSIADSVKDNQGLQLVENTVTSPVLKNTKTAANGKLNLNATSEAPVTLNATSASSTIMGVAAPSAADKILDEATKLFDQKDYSQASTKLKEVDEIIK